MLKYSERELDDAHCAGGTLRLLQLLLAISLSAGGSARRQVGFSDFTSCASVPIFFAFFDG